MKPHPLIKYIIYAFLICAIVIDCSCKKKKKYSLLLDLNGITMDSTMLYLPRSMSWQIIDSTFSSSVEIIRDSNGRDTLIVRGDSLNAIKTLLEELNRCNKERMKDVETGNRSRYYFKQVSHE